MKFKTSDHNKFKERSKAVSYTHLDVYKRQGIFFLAPLISMTVAVLAFAVIPVGDPTEVPWREGLLQLGIADFDVALLYLLGVTSFAVYGIALAGWASNNTVSYTHLDVYKRQDQASSMTQLTSW